MRSETLQPCGPFGTSWLEGERSQAVQSKVSQQPVFVVGRTSQQGWPWGSC